VTINISIRCLGFQGSENGGRTSRFARGDDIASAEPAPMAGLQPRAKSHAGEGGRVTSEAAMGTKPWMRQSLRGVVRCWDPNTWDDGRAKCRCVVCSLTMCRRRGLDLYWAASPSGGKKRTCSTCQQRTIRDRRSVTPATLRSCSPVSPGESRCGCGLLSQAVNGNGPERDIGP